MGKGRDRSRGGLTPQLDSALTSAPAGQDLKTAFDNRQTATPKVSASVSTDDLMANLASVSGKASEVLKLAQQNQAEEEAVLLRNQQDAEKNESFIGGVAISLMNRIPLEVAINDRSATVAKNEFLGLKPEMTEATRLLREQLAELDTNLYQVQKQRPKIFLLGQIEFLNLRIKEAKKSGLDESAAEEIFSLAVETGALLPPVPREKDNRGKFNKPPYGSILFGGQIYLKATTGLTSRHQALYAELPWVSKEYGQLRYEAFQRELEARQREVTTSALDVCRIHATGRFLIRMKNRFEREGFVLAESNGQKVRVVWSSGAAGFLREGDFVYVNSLGSDNFKPGDNLDEKLAKRLESFHGYIRSQAGYELRQLQNVEPPKALSSPVANQADEAAAAAWLEAETGAEAARISATPIKLVVDPGSENLPGTDTLEAEIGGESGAVME